MAKAKSRNLENVSRRLTRTIYQAAEDKERVVCLRCKQGLGLPMSSAILSVCYPDNFSIYDYRVCEELWKFKRTLGNFEKLSYRTNPDRLWSGCSEFLAAVEQASPGISPLRDCDRFLWARSAANQLEEDISQRFGRWKKTPIPTSRLAPPPPGD
jgi:hypothetical protein